MSLVHVHLLLTHVPVLGTILGLVLLAAAVARRSEDLRRAAFATFMAGALLAVPTYLTGAAAEAAVENLPGVTDAQIERHERIAGVALALVATLGVIGLAGFVAGRRAQRVARAGAYAAALVGLVTAGVMAITANTGGAIRHSEIRAVAAVDGGGHAEDHDR